MAHTAQDGSQFTNRMSMNARNSSLAANPSQSAPSQSDQSNTPKSIQDDPKAMQLVDQLKQMGFTGDDVAQAMDGDDQQQSDDQGGQQATQAAPLQIPGM
jgi:hypothetical protein